MASDRPVLFPVHPRTRARLDAAGLDTGAVRSWSRSGISEMVDLVDAAYALVTDSGGLQVESAALGVPCLTVRDTTEWPETVACGANRLVLDPAGLPDAVAWVRRPRSRLAPRGGTGWRRCASSSCAHVTR